MTHDGIFATKAEVDAEVGENVDATGWTEANINAWALHSESIINCVARYNWSATGVFAGLAAGKKYLLTAASAAYIAWQGIKYNMAGYTTRVEAEDIMNSHRDNFLRLLGIVRDQEVVSFINAA